MSQPDPNGLRPKEDGLTNEDGPANEDGLIVDRLSVHYGRVQALREISLRVAVGEIVTIVGANGSGKTSLLNAIVGAQESSDGDIRWQGRSLVGARPHQVVRRGIGLVPEGREVFGSLSVLDNLLLGAYIQTDQGDGNPSWLRSLWNVIGPVGAFASRPRVAAGLDRVFCLFPRLAERREQLAGSLSGGEQQMLAIGRALMSEPRLLLLDEPSVGLAPAVVQELLQLLPRLRADGLTILLVEQDAVAGLRIADRGYVMERGGVALEGTASALLTTERVRHAYLGQVEERADAASAEDFACRAS